MNARKHSPKHVGFFAALLVLALSTSSHAATISKSATGTDLTDGASWGGATPGSGDVATWTGASLGAGLTLGSAASWSGISVAGAASAIGVTGAGTLTLGAGGVDMSGASVNLTWAPPLTLGAGQTWTVNSGRNLIASGTISGPSVVLTKAGSGTLTIRNTTNTYSGGTIINAGQVTVDVLANAGLGTGPVTLNGGRLFLERISNTNALIVNGGEIYSENGFGNNWGGPVTLNSNLIIQGPGYARMTFGGIVSGAGGLTLNGPNPVWLAVANSYTGPTSVTGCTLQCNHANALGGGALSIGSAANSLVNLNYSGTRNIASLTLGGVQQAGGTHGSNSSPATFKNNTYFSGTGTVTVPLSPAKDILSFSFGTLGAAAVGTNTVTLDVPIGTNRTALAPTFTLSPAATCSPVSGATLDFTSAQTYTVTAQDGSTKAYTVTLTEAVLPDIFTWATATSGNWSDPSKWTNEAVPTIVVAPQAGGRPTYTLNFTTAGTYTATHNLNAGFVLNRLNLASAVTIAGSNSLALANNGANLPQLNQNSGSGVTISAPVSLAANVTLAGSGGGPVSISGVISGGGSLTKNSSGLLTISGPNSYSGGTTVNSGSLSLGGTGNSLLGTGPVAVNSPATLNLNGNNNLTNAFTLNGAVVVNGNSFSANLNGTVNMPATPTIDLGTTGNMSIGGSISGAGGLTKIGTGAGPLVLSGANNFTGAVAVRSGALSVASLNRVSGGTATSNLGAPTTVPNGTISLGSTNAVGTLRYSGPGETTDRVIRLAGNTGGGTLSQAGTSVGIPTTRGDSGFLKFTSDISVPGTAGVDNRKTLTLTHVESSDTGTNPGTGEISGSIGDSVLGTSGQLATSITKAGSGTWILSGNNTYSGATRAQAGTLAITRSNALGGGSLDITTGARLRLDFIGTRQISALTFNAGAPLASGTYGSSGSSATNKDDTRFSGPGTLTVGAIALPTTTTLARTNGSEPSNGGEAVTFTATVAGSTPTGSVSFHDGLTLIGTSPLNGSLQASLTTTALGGGVHVITAQYLGSAGGAPSTSAGLTQTVTETRTATTTMLTSGTNPSNQWRPVTFTATVSGGSPTGSVSFFDGSTLLGTATLNGSAQASLTLADLPVGWRAITARYAGDLTRGPSASATPLFQSVNPPPGNGKLKIFILAGQSNMQGKASAEIGRNPNNLTDTNFAGGLGSLRNLMNKNIPKYGYLADPANPIPGGSPGWITRSDVGVTYWSDPGTGENRRGNLNANFGNTGEGGRIGPEYSFGLVVGSQLGDKVLLIKYAFGGKSLAVDYRPPGAVAARGGVVGPYYTGMVATVNQVLANLSTYYPAYTGGGYEIAGFAWHQGFNDRINNTYVAEYEANMTNLIKDLRTQFSVPNLPVVIGDTGMDNAATGAGSLIEAQGNVANPTRHSEFTGTVTTVKTTPFDYGKLVGASDEGYHWNWSAESYFNIGESMGKAMMALLPAVNFTAYNAWSLDPAQGLTAGVNDGPTDDPDFDGIGNQLEFVLGSLPLVSSQTPLPALTKPTGAWIFTYNRSVASRPPGATQTVEYGDNLSGWTQLTIPRASAANVAITPQGATDRVEVTLPELGPKGFVRLKVVVAP